MRGVIWFNNYKIGALEKAEESFTKRPCGVLKDLEYADGLEKKITYSLLQKTVTDYEALLKILKKIRR
jgi:hypothetical protein